MRHPQSDSLTSEGTMRRTSLSLTLVATSLVLVLPAAPAHAQATRTWVSGVGDDANPCSRTAPCKTFAGAISKTATGGEINCLDPGGFGALTITKAIQVICFVEAGVLASGVNGIIVNAGTAEVLLQGLDIEGVNTGLNGVQILSASKVTIQNCSIRNFTQNGVNAAVAGARVVVVDSFIYSNNGGVNIGAAGVAAVGLVLRTTIDNHPAFSVSVANTSVLIMSASKLLGSAASVSLAAGANFTSFGDNAIGGTGTPTNTIPLR